MTVSPADALSLRVAILAPTGKDAALTATIRARESMLPILLLPVLAPVFMAGIKVTEQVLDGRDWSDFQHWLGMLVAFDLIFLTAAFLLFDLIWEEA